MNDKYKAPLVVNCAGVMCDHVTGLIKKPDYKITPNKGEYYLLDKSQGNLVHHVIFQCPTKIGKGVLVAPTVDGNLIVGPTSTNTTVDDYSTTSMGLKTIRENRGISQVELAALSGVKLRSIQMYEQKVNDIDKAQARTLYKLSRVLGCSIEDLLENPEL